MSNGMSQDKRLGWMTLGTFVPVFVTSWIAGIVAGLLARQIGLRLNLSEPVGHTLSYVSITAARLIVWVPAAHLVLKRRLRDLAFRLQRGWWLELLGGIGITTLAIGSVFIASGRLGWLAMDGWAWQTIPFDGWLGKVWASLVINTLVALGEELIFRAYLLTGLQVAWGRGKALVIMMLVFGLIHLPAYSEQGMQSFILVYALGFAAVIGAVLGLIYFRTGSLWMPMGIHLAWNFVENDLLNLTGDMTNPHLVGALTRLQGPFALTGNTFGNALVLDTLAFALLCAGLWLWFRRRNLICNLILVLIAITLLLSPSASARAETAPGPDLQAVDAYLQALVKANRIAGLAVAIVQGDQIVFMRGYGGAGSGWPMTPQTQLYIGSVTKSFTALAVMQLVEQGKLELDAPVQRYLPWFQVADAAASAQITVRHLLNHTSGLSELGDPNASTYAPTLADEARTLRHVRLTAPVGTKFQYYNKNYRVLGLLIEQASGQTYGDYLRAHVFTPLGMTRTVANPADAPDLAQSYSQAFGFPMPYPLTFHPSAVPSGYVISSAEDIARYLIAQINDGRIQDHALVQPATLAQMRTPPPGIGSRYGMGWMVFEGGNTLFHGGDLEGFHALVGIGLKEKIGFVILCNQNSLAQMMTVYDALPGDLSSLLMGKTLPKPESFAWVGLALAILAAADFLNHLRLFWQLPAWVKKTARQSRLVQWIKILPSLTLALALLLGLPSLLSAMLGSSGGWLDMFSLLPDVTAWLLIGLTLVLIRGVAKIILLARQPLISL